MLKSIDLTVNVQEDATADAGNVDTCCDEKLKRRGTLYVHLNQQTHLASLLYSRGIQKPFSIVTNFEFSMFPFIGWLQVRMGAITIVRQRPHWAKEALQRAVERLAEGDSIGISIEGRRSDDGNLCPFKKGPAVLAIAAQCDIVPFMTHGEYVLWPRGSWSVVEGGKVDIKLYPRISTAGMTYEDRDKLTLQLRNLAEAEIVKWNADNKDYIADIIARRDGSVNRAPHTAPSTTSPNNSNSTRTSLSLRSPISVAAAYEQILQYFLTNGVSEAEDSARYLLCHAGLLGYRWVKYTEEDCLTTKMIYATYYLLGTLSS